MDVTEKWGDDVDSAVELALADLNLTRDEVEIEVLEQPSRGFFGLGSKLALVRVSRKIVEEPVTEEPAATSDLKEEVLENVETIEPKPIRKEESRRPHKSRSSRDRRNGKPTKSRVEFEPVDLSELDFHKTMDSLPESEDHPALQFLKDVTKQMGLNVNMTAKADDSNVLIDISGKDSNTIIGKRGQTLDAIQYLTSLVVNKDRKDYVKVVIDVENYRERRERTLQQLAQRLAGKVTKTRRSVKLEPMNPYERKVIHATLQNNSNVVTRSEGQDPYRRVIIELK